MTYYINNVEQQAGFTIEVRVPYHLAARFADAITGNDDDVFLAAETAMRRRLDALGETESVELWPDGNQIRRDLRRTAGEIEANAREDCA